MTAAMAIRGELEALLARFAWQVDHDHGHGVEELFTPGGVYGFSFGDLVGREQIAGFYELRRAALRTSRHLFTNLHIHRADASSASATCVLTLHAAKGSAPLPLDPVMVADYDDEYVRGEDGIWRFASRRVSLVFGEYPHLRENGSTA